MKKLILYYLYGILLIPITLRILLGNLSGMPIHPGLFIHMTVLLILLAYFTKQFINGNLQFNIITKMIIGFSFVYGVNLFLVEMIQFPNAPIMPSLEYTFKIFLFLLLAYYIYQNSNYYFTKIHKILLLNSLVLVSNVIIGYHFQIGWQSYQNIEDSYRGYLAGNDTSIFSFVVFGYSLYSISSSKLFGRKLFFTILLISSLYSIYIIGTKAIIVAGIILILFLFHLRLNMKNIILIALFVSALVLLIISIPSIQERVLFNYFNNLNNSKIALMDFNNIPSNLLWLNNIMPGRFLVSILLLNQLLFDSFINIIFGYGVSGINVAFGRPPMAAFFSIIGKYGLFGFIVFYFPQLYHSVRIMKKKQFNLINVLFLSMFLYGSLGGFLYGVSNTSLMFALLFGLSLYQTHNPLMQYSLK